MEPETGKVRIILVTDAWLPQVNGVVTTLTQLKTNLEALGHEVTAITPELFHTVPLPTYPEIGLSVLPYRKVSPIIEETEPLQDAGPRLFKLYEERKDLPLLRVLLCAGRRVAGAGEA